MYAANSLDDENLESFAMNLWSLWMGRNSRLWEDKKDTSAKILHRGHSILNAWKEARRVEQLLKEPASTHVTRQSKPPLGVFKCNIDATFTLEANSTRMGICVRDHNGHFVLAKAVSIHPHLSTKEREALGVLYRL